MAKQLYSKGTKFSGNLEKALIKPESKTEDELFSKQENLLEKKEEKSHFSGKARELFQDKIKKNRKASHTFYLEDDIFEELSFISKKSGRSISDVLNEVLRNAL